MKLFLIGWGIVLNNKHAFEYIPADLCVITDGHIVYGNRGFRILTGYAINAEAPLRADQVFNDLPDIGAEPPPTQKVSAALQTVDGNWLGVDVKVAQSQWQGQPALIVCVDAVTSQRASTPDRHNGHHNTEADFHRLRDRLMTTMAHEFRTPLSLIMTSVDMLDRYGDRLSAQQRTQRLQEVRVQVSRLTTMLDDINFIVREKSIVTFQPVRLRLLDLVQRIVEDFRQKALPFQQIVIESECAECMALIDEQLIQRTLYSLLQNAMQYGSPQDDIRIRLWRVDDDIHISVIDQGESGIPPDEQPHVFEAFFRGGNNHTDGSGLGLTIARYCVRLHRGEISLTSAPGETAFSVHLPQAAA